MLVAHLVISHGIDDAVSCQGNKLGNFSNDECKGKENVA